MSDHSKSWEDHARKKGRRRVGSWLEKPDLDKLRELEKTYGTEAQVIRVAIRRLAEGERK